jgi:hypothetical protein
MNVKKLIIASFLCLVFTPSFAATKNLTCMSANKSFVRCDLPDADMRDIRITKYKIGNCHLDDAWGVDSRGIWVDKGCGAEFEYGPVGRSYSSSSSSKTVVVVPGLAMAHLASAVLYNGHAHHYQSHHYHHAHCGHYGHHR